jgi:L-ribulose-5-phosphate 3-epimerase
MNTRRDLLRTGAALLGAAQLAPALDRPVGARYPISLAQWSLHRMLYAGELTTLDFPGFTRERFDLAGVEYVNSFFKDKAGDFGYLRELRRRCDDAGVESLLIMVDGEGALGAADDAERRRSIENHFKWLAAAAYLGGHSIRVNAGGSGDRDEHSKRASDSLHRLCVMAEPYGLNVIVENHGGPSSDGAWLAETIRRADHPACGTLPDFGNFRIQGDEWYDRYRGVQELMPFARAVSAKSHEFDAEGNEVHTDYRRMLELVDASGYSGWIGIEYEGSKLSEVDGVALTLALLRRELSPEGR